jgi:hypothetical protein
MTESTTPIASDTAEPTRAEIAALIAKHRDEIDRVLPPYGESQINLVEKYGVDIEAVKKHYAYMQVESDNLRARYDQINQISTKTGWAFLGGSLATLSALAFKRRIAESSFIQGAIVIVGSIVAGLLGRGIGWKLAGGQKVLDESRILALDARRALERELAIGMENQEIKAAQAAKTPASQEQTVPQSDQQIQAVSADAALQEKADSPSPAQKFSSAPRWVPPEPRGKSYAEAAITEKLAAANTVAAVQ